MLCHFEGQCSAAQNMKMQMIDGLARIRSAVRNHPVAVFQTLLLCDLRNDLKNVCYHSAVFGSYAGN